MSNFRTLNPVSRSPLHGCQMGTRVQACPVKTNLSLRPVSAFATFVTCCGQDPLPSVSSFHKVNPVSLDRSVRTLADLRDSATPRVKIPCSLLQIVRIFAAKNSGLFGFVVLPLRYLCEKSPPLGVQVPDT